MIQHTISCEKTQLLICQVIFFVWTSFSSLAYTQHERQIIRKTFTWGFRPGNLLNQSGEMFVDTLKFKKKLWQDPARPHKDSITTKLMIATNLKTEWSFIFDDKKWRHFCVMLLHGKGNLILLLEAFIQGQTGHERSHYIRPQGNKLSQEKIPGIPYFPLNPGCLIGILVEVYEILSIYLSIN